MHSLALPAILSASTVVAMVAVNFPSNNLLWASLQNTGHLVLFAALTFTLLVQLCPSLRLNRRSITSHIALILTLIALGGFIELIHMYMPGRSASSEDLMLDTAGILLGYILFFLFMHYKSLPGPYVIVLTITALTLTTLASKSTLGLAGYHLFRSDLPSIVSFEDPFVLSTISVTGDASVSIVNSMLSKDVTPPRLLRMDLAKGTYSGVIFHDTGGRWGDGGYLVFSLYNETKQTRQMVLRIHDIHHNNEYDDRFNESLLVKPGLNDFSIAINKIRLSRNPEAAKSLTQNGKGVTASVSRDELDMNNLSEIQLFSIDQHAMTVLLSGLQLLYR